MSDNIPLEVQQEIIKWFPLKSLLQFRSVSKEWKSFIDSSKFINDYHIIHKHPQRLFVRYEQDFEMKFISIIDNDTFPLNTSLVAFPESIKIARFQIRVIGCSNGLFCLHGFFPVLGLDTQMVVLWNPFLRKAIEISVPRGSEKKVPEGYVIHAFHLRSGVSVVGFGVCTESETSDVKLVMINSSIPTHWVVKVFVLSSREWRSVSFDPPFESCDLSWNQESVNGFIYWLGYDDVELPLGTRSNLIVSFDLKTEMLGRVQIPDILVHSKFLRLSKRNECLTLIECTQEGERDVWMMNDECIFTKMFTVKSCGPSLSKGVFGFRKNGEAIIVTIDEGDDIGLSQLKVYDPFSGDFKFKDIEIGEIKEYEGPFSVRSYMETLLLLGQYDSISH